MTKRRTPTYELQEVKRLIRDGQIIPSRETIDDANNIGFSITEAHDVILELGSAEFYKTKPEKTNPRVWQDVYKKTVRGQRIYIKFKIVNDEKLLLTSFKKDTSK